LLASDRDGVDVVTTALASRASVERALAVVGEGAIDNGEAASWAGTSVTLELGGGRSKDTSTAVSIGNLAVVDAVLCSLVGEAGGLTDTVLTISELTNSTTDTTRGSETEAALVSGRQASSAGSKGKAQWGDNRSHREG